MQNWNRKSKLMNPSIEYWYRNLVVTWLHRRCWTNGNSL